MNRLLELAKDMARQAMPAWLGMAQRATRPAGPGNRPVQDDADASGYSDSTLELQRIEVQAERTIVQEIRLFERHVRSMLPALHGDDLAYAHGLLLKLDRLAGEQQAGGMTPSQVLSACADDWLQLPA
jgi:hypothetical protein